ncbi:MAG: hypothetical protein HFH32_03750 [Eubacterium sp.]|jgi:capsular polysaccharide biosynthesis protein|nr:hypothetical protein [Eubacterium sp.]
MDGQYSWKRTEDIELDLADLLKKLCMQWKRIFICALFAAVLAGAYGYTKYKNSTHVPDTAEEAELTVEELQSVMSAVEQHTDIQMQEEYLEGSVLMKTDPYHKHRVYMLYSIHEAERRDIQKITESYLNFIVNGGASQALRESGRSVWDMDKSYLAELFTAYQKNYDSPYQEVIENPADTDVLAESVFYVEITGRDERMAKQMADDLQQVLKKQQAEVKAQAGSHRLTLLDTEHNILSDSNLLAQQRDKKAQLANSKANLKALTDAFSEKQAAVYQKEAGVEDDMQKPDEESADDMQSREDAGNAAGFLAKYIILGLVGGIFVFCGFFGCWYLLCDTVKSGEEMKNLYTFPFYGGIPLADTPKDASKQAEAQILNRIRLSCKKQGITRLCAASDFAFTDSEKQCMEHLARQLDDLGIHAEIAENAGSDTVLWDNLAETGNVLLVCRIGTTTHRMIDDAMRFYMENGIHVAGAMAFQKNL